MRFYALSCVILLIAADKARRGPGVKAGKDAVFDFDAALAMARRLYALAGSLTAATSRRQALAQAAQRSFAGAYAGQFAARMSVEQDNVASVAAGLRQDAGDLAQMWAQAMDNRNRLAYAHHVDALKTRRDELHQITDWLTGGFHYPPEPGAVSVPQPPGFAATAAPVRYLSPTG